MSKLIILFALLFSTNAIAKKVKLSIHSLYKDGESQTRDSKFTVHAIVGKEWIVPIDKKGELRLKMNVLEDKSSLKLNGEVRQHLSSNSTVVARPEFVTEYDRESIFTVERENGHYIELRFIVESL